MDYQGSSKVIKALSVQKGGGGGNGLPRLAGDVETWTSGIVTVQKLMIGVVSLTIKSADYGTAEGNVLTLPSKYRPLYDIFVEGMAYNESARGVGIKKSGVVTVYGGSTGIYLTVTYIVPVDWEYAVVNYYRNATDAVIRKINALGSGWESFIVLTDTHGSYNKQHSQNIVRQIIEETDIKAFWLGDTNSVLWEGSGQSYGGEEYNTFAEQLRPCSNKVYFALGNHDRAAWDGLDYNDIKIIYNDFIASKDVTGNKERYYYYFDIPDKKLRYVVLNTSESTTDYHRMSATQLEWIKTAVTLPASNWAVVVLGHLDIDPNTFCEDGSDDGATIISNINTCNGRVVGYFCGHQHLDLITNTGRFRQITLMCDKFSNIVYYPDYQIPERIANTDSEQALTVIHVNTSTRRVEFTRIGAFIDGQIKNFTY